MTSFFPTMRMKTVLHEGVDDMYNIHCHAGNLCRTAIMESLEEVLTLRSAKDTKQPISIADFGTADGLASLSLMNEVIDEIKGRLGEKQAIVVYYNDQPMNDFNRLSNVIHGFVKSKMAYASVMQTKQQFLIQEQAKDDWRTFVISRGREIKPGGFIITMNISSDENGDEAMIVDKGTTCIGSFVTDMARNGVITQEEYRATNLNSYYLRKAADFVEPFISDIPEIRELGLELVSIKSMKHYLRHPTFDIVNKDNTDKMEYSQRIVSSTYPWMYHVVHDGLSNSRTEEEKRVIIDQYFNRLRDYVYVHSDHKPYLIFTEVVIKKRKTV